MKTKTDTEEYRIDIINIALLMPIAQLTQGVFNEYNTILTRQIDNKPVGISYRKIEIRPITIPRNSEVFYSELLFSDEMPLKIIICFVETNRVTGDYLLNPFLFNRKWTVTTSSIEVPQPQSESEELKRRLDQAESLNRELLSQLQKLNKGKGRGKKTRQDPLEGTSTRFVQFGGDMDTVSVTSDESGNSTSNLRATTKTVYLKKVELLLNGQPIDGLEGKNYP